MVYRVFLFIALFSFSGCGIYSFKGSLPPELKTIYVDDFVTAIAFYNVDQNLTNVVTTEFIGDNTLQIINDRNKADLILKGKIISIVWETYSIAEGASQAKEDRLTLTLDVDCYRKDLKKNLWKKRWERYALLPLDANQEDTEAALLFIITEFSEDIVLNTVAVW